jgi:hypothetical protein
MRVYVLSTHSQTHASAVDEAEAIAVTVAEISRLARRNTLVLFTAHERLRRAHARLRALLPGRAAAARAGPRRHGRASRRALPRRARRGLARRPEPVEGVDFPGEALEVLVVARLPFSVPDDPVVEARGERLRERGLEPFRHDSVPEAVMRFRQGVGRLIRRATDRGVLVVCDARLARASYRGPFRAALPVEPTLWNDPRDLAHEAGGFPRHDGRCTHGGESVIRLGVSSLALDDVVDLARGEVRVEFPAEARQRVRASRRVVDDAVRAGRVVYGVTTGFGRLKDQVVPADDTRALQFEPPALALCRRRAGIPARGGARRCCSCAPTAWRWVCPGCVPS